MRKLYGPVIFEMMHSGGLLLSFAVVLSLQQSPGQSPSNPAIAKPRKSIEAELKAIVQLVLSVAGGCLIICCLYMFVGWLRAWFIRSRARADDRTEHSNQFQLVSLDLDIISHSPPSYDASVGNDGVHGLSLPPGYEDDGLADDSMELTEPTADHDGAEPGTQEHSLERYEQEEQYEEQHS